MISREEAKKQIEEWTDIERIENGNTKWKLKVYRCYLV
jgi:hypothetical protein